ASTWFEHQRRAFVLQHKPLLVLESHGSPLLRSGKSSLTATTRAGRGRLRVRQSEQFFIALPVAERFVMSLNLARFAQEYDCTFELAFVFLEVSIGFCIKVNGLGAQHAIGARRPGFWIGDERGVIWL